MLLKNAENLIADEFSAELAEGVAYVAGHDDDSRPVLVIFSISGIIFFWKKKEKYLNSWRKCLALVTDIQDQARLPEVPLPETVSLPNRKHLNNYLFL